MTLACKREVIEVLLCAGPPPQPSCCESAAGLEYERRIGYLAVERWAESFASFDGSYQEIAVDAAYLLLESSPTLRHEWWGA